MGGAVSHAVAPFKQRLRDALESDSLPMALGRVLPLLDGRRREAFDGRDFPAEQARLAAIRKRDVADGPRLLEQFTAVAEKAGMVVHPPADADAVRETVAELLRQASARMVVKSKSMATEEIGLRQALEADGLEVVETDLGEFLVQIADELPSHIVAPALHITRERAAELIGSATGQDLPPDPDTLVQAAREYLRDKFIAADAGITGANALVASTGSVMLVSNEGNARLCSSLPSLHIVVAGVDKLVATMTDAAATLDMLPASATGQTMSSYVSFISGPSRSADIEMSLSLGVHGPRDVHVVLLDNGREAMRRDPDFQTALQCVRCGACSNVCPTYQQVGGHAMGHIYTGPIGLLLTSFHHGMENVAEPQALCAGCGACATVCPAGIPIPELIQEVRTRAVDDGAAKNRLKSLALGVLADSRAFEKGLRTVTRIPGVQALARRLPGSPLRARPLPPVAARPFRDRLPALAAADCVETRRWPTFLAASPTGSRRRPAKRRCRCSEARRRRARRLRVLLRAAGHQRRLPRTGPAHGQADHRGHRGVGRRHRRQHVHELPGRHPRRLSAPACGRTRVAGTRPGRRRPAGRFRHLRRGARARRRVHFAAARRGDRARRLPIASWAGPRNRDAPAAHGRRLHRARGSLQRRMLRVWRLVFVRLP